VEEEEEEEIDAGADGDIETDVDGPSNGKLPKLKANDKNDTVRASRTDTRASAADYFGSNTYATTSKYHWEDHTESEAGTNRGWLRISDDSVEECGIERVLAEGTGAFMLYYERAVHPSLGVYMRGRTKKGVRSGKATPRGQSERGGARVNGTSQSLSRSRSRSRNGRASAAEDDGGADTDADGLSIGSEETLKPEMKVVDLNGSVGSLVSEVGVGVMKVHKKHSKGDKEKERDAKRKDSMTMSMQLPGPHSSSLPPFTVKGFGPRIIRNVSAGRRKTLKANGLMTLSASSSEAGSPSPEPRPLLNGSTVHANGDEEKIPPDMIASAPSILDTAAPSLNGSSSRSGHSHPHTGLGSRSTKILHHSPPTNVGVKVKAR